MKKDYNIVVIFDNDFYEDSAWYEDLESTIVACLMYNNKKYTQENIYNQLLLAKEEWERETFRLCTTIDLVNSILSEDIIMYDLEIMYL